MWTVIKKELTSFLSGYAGYMVVSAFLILCGLIIWIFPEINIYDSRYASLDIFFEIVPYIFFFLIPAITMSTFSEEKDRGTIELLLTKPISLEAIIGGKYFASLMIVILALIPTLLYFLTVYRLGSPVGNIDIGQTIGSYLALLFLGMTFCSIGVFASAISSNQVTSFLLALFICFISFIGFDYFSRIPLFTGGLDRIIQDFGIKFHFDNLSKGILELRDVVYFLSVIALFIGSVKYHLQMNYRS
jgi:ABC-2 type transport system permease protein